MFECQTEEELQKSAEYLQGLSAMGGFKVTIDQAKAAILGVRKDIRENPRSLEDVLTKVRQNQPA